MNYKFYTNSIRSWEAMYEAISFAEHTIYLEMYIFSDDMKDFDFLKLLKEKAKNGVRVCMILDSYGSADLNKKAISDLNASGVELFFISHFLHHAHRKILIIDERVAFVGGVNFHQSASSWNDLVVQVKGKIIKIILKSFAKVYEKCGGKDFFILRYKKNDKVFSKKIHFWLIEHFPMWQKYNLKKFYEKNINESEKSVFLATPYFMPKRWFIATLHQAVLRGVRVEVLVPKATDYFLIDRVNYFFMHKLSRLGVNIYLEDDMNHAKLVIIDSKKGTVGSHNLDILSFDFNSEAGIFFDDQGAVKKLVNIYEGWRDGATPFDFKGYNLSLLDYILSPIISIFSKIL